MTCSLRKWLSRAATGFAWRTPARRAFTLIEVLIAIALILALGGTMYGFLYDMLNSRSRVLEHVACEAAATTLIRQIDVDVLTCIVGDSVHGAGIRGDNSHLRIISRGVAAQLATRGIDDADLFGDLQFANYRHNPRSNRIEGRRGTLGAPNATQAPFTEIDGEIAHLRFRYFDGEQWLDFYDSLARDKLPVALEIAIWHAPWPSQVADDAQSTIADTEQTDSAGAPASEDAAAQADDLPPDLLIDDDDLPRPDRRRVIIVPDAVAASGEEPPDA